MFHTPRTQKTLKLGETPDDDEEEEPGVASANGKEGTKSSALGVRPHSYKINPSNIKNGINF